VGYDEELADRIRELLGGRADLVEKKMFGGLAFLIGGNMAVAASGQGGVLVRVDPAQSASLIATTNARLMEMRGRRLDGWLRVDADDVRTKRQLAKWVAIGATYARSRGNDGQPEHAVDNVTAWTEGSCAAPNHDPEIELPRTGTRTALDRA
jgi:TfoX N-terminal domain